MANSAGIGAKRMAYFRDFLRKYFRCKSSSSQAQARSAGLNRLGFRTATLDIASFTIAPLA